MESCTRRGRVRALEQYVQSRYSHKRLTHRWLPKDKEPAEAGPFSPIGP